MRSCTRYEPLHSSDLRSRSCRAFPAPAAAPHGDAGGRGVRRRHIWPRRDAGLDRRERRCDGAPCRFSPGADRLCLTAASPAGFIRQRRLDALTGSRLAHVGAEDPVDKVDYPAANLSGINWRAGARVASAVPVSSRQPPAAGERCPSRKNSAPNVGRVIEVKGVVIDVAFEGGRLPGIYNALEIEIGRRRRGAAQAHRRGPAASR